MPNATTKPTGIENIAQAREAIPDLKVYGNGDLWTLLCKASSDQQNWLKSTKAMFVEGAGCLVQVTTEMHGTRIAEALTWVPGVHIGKDVQGQPCLKDGAWARDAQRSHRLSEDA